MRRPHFSPAVGILGALAVGCAGASHDSRPRVEQGELAPTIVLSGEVVAERSVPFIAPNVGLWPLQVRWVVDDGSRLEAGEPVVAFDHGQLAEQLSGLESAIEEKRRAAEATRARVAGEVARADLALERAEIAVAKARLDADVPLEIFAEREAARRRDALAKAELELVLARTTSSTAREGGAAEVRLADLAVANAEQLAARARADLERLALAAPESGIVVLSELPWEGRASRIGDSVWPGTTVATLPDLASSIIEARLFDVDEGAVTPGLPAQVVLDGYPERPLSARVREVDATARELGRSPLRRAFRVTLVLEQIDRELLRPGMSARVEIAQPRLSDTLLVPRSAIEWDQGATRLRLADGARAAVVVAQCTAQLCALAEGPPAGTLLAASTGSAP